MYAPALGPYFPVLIAMGSVLASTFLYWNYDGPMTPTNQLWALFNANLGVLPFVFYFMGGRRSDFPVFELICAWYGVSMGWSAFASDLKWFETQDENITKAFGIAFTGLIALFLGFYLIPQKRRVYLTGKPFSLKDPREFHFVLALGLLGASILMSLLGLRGPGADQVRLAFGACGLSLAWLYSYKPGVPEWHRWLIVGATVMIFLIQALGASLKPLIIPIIVMAMSYWRVHHRVPYRMIIVVVLLFVTLNPVKHLWREKIGFWKSTKPEVSIVDNIVAFEEAFTDYYFGPNTLEIEGEKNTVNRVADIGIFSRVVEWTPQFVPYWGGETLKSLPYTFVPRLLWPSKPRSGYGNEFGRRYEIISIYNYNTAVSMSWITEMYSNFGTWGVWIGMTLIGWLARLAQDSFGARDVTDLQFAIGIGAAGPLYNAGENLSMIWGAFPLKIFVLMLVVNLAYWMLYEHRGMRREAMPRMPLTPPPPRPKPTPPQA